MKKDRSISFLEDVTDSELLDEVQHRQLFNTKSKYWNSLDYQTKMELFESMIDKFTYDELKARLTK